MDITNVVVSIATPVDTAYLLDLGRRTTMTSISEQRPVELHLAQLAYTRMLDYVFSQKPVVFMATTAGKNVGFLLYVDFLPDDVTGQEQAFVAYMAVEPIAQRQGIGRKLLAAAEEYARSKGLPAIALMVTEQNLAARGVYEAAGYTTERRLLCKPLG